MDGRVTEIGCAVHHGYCGVDVAGWMLRSFRSLMFVRRLKDVAVVAESEVLLALPGCQPNGRS